MIVVLGWPFDGKDTVIFPPLPLGAVVTKDVIAAMEAGNGLKRLM